MEIESWRVELKNLLQSSMMMMDAQSDVGCPLEIQLLVFSTLC